MENLPGLSTIYADTPIELAPAKIITSFPVNTFLENLAIAPDGSTTIIAQAEQGVVGSTAVAFGQSEGDAFGNVFSARRFANDERTAIYVVTNGGMFLPPPTGVVPANVVRLEVGKAGYPLA